MKTYKKIEIQRNPSTIRLDYLMMTGAKDLEDLKINYRFYWEQLNEELNRVSGFSKEKERKEIPAHRINFANLVDEVYLCKACKKELIYIIHKKKLYYQDTPHEYDKGIAKVKCICREVNIIYFREEDEKIDKENKELK